jgi:2-polyprenyl-6-methoxyphenol hydroxylase-like FAD-dependent oxidoreductase
MIGQPVIEAIMSRELDSLVLYNEHVTSISESQDGVHVVTQTGRSVHAAYSFAADGARSTVRSALGIPFEGTKPEMVWAVLDTFIDTDFPVCPEIITFELRGQSRVAWIPRERGLSRFYVLLDDDGGEDILEIAQEAIKEHLAPYRVGFRSTEWSSTFEGM